MSTAPKGRNSEGREEATSQDDLLQVSNTDDALEADGTPVLDEVDLEENGITEEEADNIEWDDAR